MKLRFDHDTVEIKIEKIVNNDTKYVMQLFRRWLARAWGESKRKNIEDAVPT